MVDTAATPRNSGAEGTAYDLHFDLEKELEVMETTLLKSRVTADGANLMKQVASLWSGDAPTSRIILPLAEEDVATVRDAEADTPVQELRLCDHIPPLCLDRSGGAVHEGDDEGKLRGSTMPADSFGNSRAW